MPHSERRGNTTAYKETLLNPIEPIKGIIMIPENDKGGPLSRTAPTTSPQHCRLVSRSINRHRSARLAPGWELARLAEKRAWPILVVALA